MPDHALFDFSGGWNTRKPPVLLADNELRTADNIQLFPGGGFGKRRGYNIIGNNDSNTSIVSGLFPFSTPTGTKHLVRTKNSKIEHLNAGTWTDITGGLTVTTTGDVKQAFGVFRGSLVGTNGTDIPWKWTGTGNAASITQAIGGGADTIDKAAAICVHRERLVLGDVTATESSVTTRYESVIWPSDAGTLDTWSSGPTGRIHLGQGDGDSITCMLSLLGYLVVFKQNSMWRVSDHGASTQVATRVANVGTPSKHGAVVADGRVYFLSTSGLLFVYDPRQGDSPDALVELTTAKIGSWNIEKLVGSRLAYAHLTHNELNNEILCFLDDTAVSATTPAQPAAWVYNIALGAFTRWRFLTRRINVSTYGWNPNSSEDSLMYGSSDGFVLIGDRLGVDHDGTSSTDITMTVDLAPTACGSPGTQKSWRWAYLYSNSQQLDSALNDSPTADTIDVYQFAALPAISTTLSTNLSTALPAQAGPATIEYDSIAEVRLNGYSRHVMLRLIHGSNRRIRISGVLLNYEPSGPRR